MTVHTSHQHLLARLCACLAAVVEGLKAHLRGLQPQLALKAAEAASLVAAVANEQEEAMIAQVGSTFIKRLRIRSECRTLC